MKKQKLINIILIALVSILLCVLIGVTIYQKIEENKKKYSKEKLLEIYNTVKYDDKTNIYLFYGDGCPHCEAEMNFFSNLDEEYTSKYNFYKFETWYNQNTEKLKKLVVDQLVEDGYIDISVDKDNTLKKYYDSVPVLIIGNESFVGYIEDFDEDIKQTIVEQLDNDYDVMKKLDLK